MPVIERSALESQMGIPMPKMKDVRSMLRYNPVASVRDKVLEAYIVGSVAKGTNGNESDLDIAVIIPAKKAVSDYKFTDRYHQKFMQDSHKPNWQGMRVDFQFYYSSDALSEFSRMDCSK